MEWKSKRILLWWSIIIWRRILNRKLWNGKSYFKNEFLEYELKEGKGYIKEYKDNYLIFEG